MQASAITLEHKINQSYKNHVKWEKADWYALYTRSRHEKIVECQLGKKSIECFLPIRRITRHWSDRTKVIEEPLFKGYLFAQIPWKDRYKVLNTTGVVNFVVGANASDPITVRENELLTIKRFLDEDIPMDPFPYLKEGQRVYVRSGKFKGAEGFIVRKGRHCRLVISLDILMQSISVELDQACVEIA